MKRIWENKSWIVATLAIIITFFVLIVSLESNSVTVKVNQLNIRSGPDVTYSVRAKVKQGQRLQVISRKSNWIKVIYQHKTIGWVAAWLVQNSNVQNVTRLSEATIVLDPGHGGSDTGALSMTGQPEKRYTLEVAKRVERNLQARGARVVMTRSSDKTVPLAARPEIANSSSANLFVSFHFDSSDENNVASGYTCYFYHNGDSKQLAKSVNDQMKNLPLSSRGVEFGNFLVIRDNSVPAILIEGGYINTSKDFKQIQNPTYQKKLADDVVDGIANYFKTNN
ncbi:N-acetylmuramoyl-L-alanine amidase [Lentilactobacillus otakiensis]|uniref:Cell wall hydrolase/autolysin n=1 Tax=Lentilactobacillus otakiensis DSM 19908 = JCM 15040 TaxID=1423780 RepID=S4NIS6_9LACO|nr:N-acetylmuramoyl-L-alanine amidase [Lentilactobacillus otakiensis]KRL09117.1 cell wall hydrolase autolysin [Lentilactobacillus otakiensis DSM 19908 = JCM 15040]MBZ3775732.1 N-acetylmuramoyl-L-alanine amidase [Lentilactobacillus otakiensis]MDV3518951.1 N-acetylmuramoyl-L-alanine amidase [Lentilactobacillus otakiensis]GAD15886.1 cell wall hydrolase/autolysin [Lentilactobacillus otakiensis DSM 19908 = JCM 15040]